MKKHTQLKTKAKNYAQYSLTCFFQNNTFHLSPIYAKNFVFLDIGNCTQAFFSLNFYFKKTSINVCLNVQNLKNIYHLISFGKSIFRLDSFINNYFQVLIQKKIFVKGFFLNKTRYSIVVGFFGFCGIIPKKQLFSDIKSSLIHKKIFFSITAFDFHKKHFAGSQKDLIKKVNRILLKLASRLVFVFKNNK